MVDNNKIGNFIATLRKEKGLTQQELGDKLFVTDKAVSKWERGLSFPDITILEKLAKELDVDVSEILCGERGKKKKVNIQEEIDKAVSRIEEDKKKKRKAIKNKFNIILLIVVLCLLFIGLFLFIRYKFYHPSVIKEGDNPYELGFFGIYSLEDNGLDEFIEIMNKTKKVSDYDSNVVRMNISLSKKGNIKNASLTIDYFDKNHNYVGEGYYNYKNRNLNYIYKGKDECETVSECEVNKMLVMDYLKSLNIKYLNDKIKMIPINDQIELSNLKYYELSISPNESFVNATNVFDMRDSREVVALSLSDYKSGKGGQVSPGIYLVINLSDGSSAIADEMYKYVFDSVDGDIKRTDYTMETDYYINGKNELLFTRDYGKSWIKTDLSSNDVGETLNFYRDISLLNSSWFISTNELVPIAYFYGETPKLKISTDNGKTWDEKIFDIVDIAKHKEISRRVVGFNNQNFGYVALGTDWTMGSGEYKKAYLTNNSGKDWEEIKLPEGQTSKVLKDFIMYDNNTGIVLLNNSQNNEFPYMYVTKDKGASWSRSEYEVDTLRGIDYITNIDSIEKDNDRYIVVLSQGDSSTSKIKISSSDLINWRYEAVFTSNIHTVG